MTRFSDHLEHARSYWKEVIVPGDHIIDATCGNGHDTFFLTRLLKGSGQLSSYDIQQDALEKTALRLHTLPFEERSIVSLKHASHEVFEEKAVKLIVYNLGYLPGGDKTITTKTTTTLKSLNNALQIATAISVICYPGHDEGAEEEKAVFSLIKSLSPLRWSICVHQWINRPKGPSLIWIESHP